jgi:hypothetical protein
MTVEEAHDRFEQARQAYVAARAMYAATTGQHIIDSAFEDMLAAGDAYNLARKAVAA